MRSIQTYLYMRIYMCAASLHSCVWGHHLQPQHQRTLEGGRMSSHDQRICFIRMPHSIDLNSMEFHGIPWNSMEFPGSPWKSMEVHGIPWNSMEFQPVTPIRVC